MCNDYRLLVDLASIAEDFDNLCKRPMDHV
ncbi:hypothetical protein SAMN05518866_11317 [Sphingobium sp. YR768]|nr:hypothetical protein SAMN05518866_11317 [Sphingobium sp. YR768]